MKKENNHWLDLCRAIAILMVLLSHGRGYLIPIWGPFNGLKFGGFLGVELFFALSGFLIGRIIIKKSIHGDGSLSWIPSFWFRRWARTYPIYIIFLLLNLTLLSEVRVAQIDNIWPFFVFTQSLTSPHPSFFGEAWSLAIEELFYLITPILYATIYFFIKDLKKSFLLCLILMITLPAIYRVYLATQTSFSFNDIRTISLAQLDSIMYGVAFSWVFYYEPKLKKTAMSIARVLVILLPFLIYLTHLPDDFMNSHTFIKIALFNVASLVCASLVVCGINIRLPEFLISPVNIIARGSYISYLVNLPILYTMHKYTPPQSGTMQGVTLWFAYLFSTILISYLIHELLEKKILMLRDRISPG